MGVPNSGKIPVEIVYRQKQMDLVMIYSYFYFLREMG